MTLRLEWTDVEIKLDGDGKVTELENIRSIEGRYVYVIQSPKRIGYPKGVSRICYIGRSGERGTRNSRLYSHASGWIFRFLALNPNEPFKISFCHPRRRNFAVAYEDLEAFLLGKFKDDFGTFPLFNKRGEREKAEYDVELNTTLFRRLPSKAAIKAFQVADEVAIEG